MELGLHGRVAVVGASTRGLGRGTAEALAADGASVVVNGRTVDAVDAAVAEIRGQGGDAVGFVGDMSDPDTPADLVARALDAFGRLDVVIGNNGGPPPAGPLD